METGGGGVRFQLLPIIQGKRDFTPQNMGGWGGGKTFYLEGREDMGWESEREAVRKMKIRNRLKPRPIVKGIPRTKYWQTGGRRVTISRRRETKATKESKETDNSKKKS